MNEQPNSQRSGSSRSQEDYPRFLQDDFPERPAADCRFHIIPCPLERSVSYGGGTANGPRAILEASRQLEAWLEDCIPGDDGIHTSAEIDCNDDDIQSILGRLGDRIRDVFSAGHFPLTIGGEHSISAGPIAALKQIFDDRGETFGVVQIDAHADLRDAYEGNRHSHASVMRRVTDLEIPLFQIGVRSLCVEEIEARRDHQVGFLDAREIAIDGVSKQILPGKFPKNIYITFDVDGFDASLMPATGTPEPGGLMWYDAVQDLENVVQNRTVIAADLVELAPIADQAGPTFTAAKTAYQIMRVSRNQR